MAYHASSERVAAALAHAMKEWEKHRESASDGTSALSRWTIAISREAGAQGSSVAHHLGTLLGWPVYDRELLQKIADEKNLRVQLLESVDEKHTSWLESVLQGVVTGPHVSETAYVRYLAESLFSLSAMGQCVIVGRGAAMILPARSTLRVRLIAPEKDRIAHIQRHFGLSEADAERWVRKADHDRSWFVQEYFHKNPGDVTAYDVVLNTGRYTAEAAAHIIVESLRRLTSA